MQVFANDLNVWALAGQGFFGVLHHLLAVGIVLIQQVDLFHVRQFLDETAHGFHLHRRVCIKTEMPVAAFAVGQVRVHR